MVDVFGIHPRINVSWVQWIAFKAQNRFDILAGAQIEQSYPFGEFIGHYDWVVLVVAMFLLMTLIDRYWGFHYPLIIRILGPFFMVPAFLAYYRDYAWYLEAGLWIIGIILPAIGFWFSQLEIKSEQEAKDTVAKETLEEVRTLKKSTLDFALYLRGFSWENKLTTQNMEFDGPQIETPTHIDLETIIVRSLEPLETVAVGNPSDVFGAGKISTTDANWQDVVADLADAAKLIVFIPVSSKGAIWEAEEIVTSKHLEKCVFVMPMSPTPSLSYHNEWRKTQSVLKKRGLALPNYQSGGLLFRFNKDKTIAAQKSLDAVFITTHHFRKAFKRVAPWI